MLPAFVSYLLKLSLGLTAGYLFYRLVLQNLTFYQYNRWFLLIFTALSFLIPLVDITDWVEPKQHTFVVKYIPAIEGIATGNFSVVPYNISEPVDYDLWNWLLIVLVAGSGILLTKSIIQFFSFIQIRRRASLVSDLEVKIYQVDRVITPFSFGRSIFLNASIQQEQDLQEIIRHELVHVQQSHTADILWMELVCILNWFNPFAWLLRHHVRQNLEFIADNHVLQTGTDKKHYQYLLLQITGEPAFHLAHQFNFSPLKKRIIMMNKKSNTRLHLFRFSFLLPLVAILLVSFRGIEKSSESRVAYILSQQDFDPKQDTPHIIGREYPKENTAIFIFNDGSRVTYDLRTEGGKARYVEAQKFIGDAYYPNNPKRNYDPHFKKFMKLNPQIAEISWRYDMEVLKSLNLAALDETFISLADRIYLTLKSGKKEIYPLETKADLARLENKYGKLPMVPLAPPTIVPAK